MPGSYKGRKDYGGGKCNITSGSKDGDKGIGPRPPSSGGSKTTKGVDSVVSAGNKGVVPFGKNPSAKAPKD